MQAGHALLLVLLVTTIVTYCAAQAGNCALTGQPPAVSTLAFCVEYSGQNSCCSAQQDGLLQQNFQAQIAPLYGNPDECCYNNTRLIFCAWNCATNASIFLQIAPNANNISNVTINVYNATYDAWFNSCSSRCFPGVGITVGQYFLGNALAFMQQFDSSNDPNFTATPQIPRIFWGQAALAAGGLSPVKSLTAGCGADLPSSCLIPTLAPPTTTAPPAKPTKAPSHASFVDISSALLFVLCGLVLHIALG